MTTKIDMASPPEQKKRRYMERKCTREKQRRNEFNQGLDRLSEFLYQVEPSLQSGKSEGIDVGQSITNRSDLVNVTVRVITKLYKENKALSATIEAKCTVNPSLSSAFDSRLPEELHHHQQGVEISASSTIAAPTLANNMAYPNMISNNNSTLNASIPMDTSRLAALIQQQRLQVLQMQHMQASASANLALSQHPSMRNSLQLASTLPQQSSTMQNNTNNLQFIPSNNGGVNMGEEYLENDTANPDGSS
jgi:hypothetical protein